MFKVILYVHLLIVTLFSASPFSVKAIRSFIYKNKFADISDNYNLVRTKSSFIHTMRKEYAEKKLTWDKGIGLYGDLTIHVDYSEYYTDKLLSLYYSDKKDIVVYYNSMYYMKENGSYYKFRSNDLLFADVDFTSKRSTAKALVDELNANYYTTAVIERKFVDSLYYPYETFWRQYFINPDDEVLIFKYDIDYQIKNEIVNPIFQKTYPSKLFPLWESQTRPFISNRTQYAHRINEVMRVPNLFEVWDNRRLLINENLIELPEELITSFKNNKKYRLDTLNDVEKTESRIINLTNYQLDINNPDDLDVLYSNRSLLEFSFPELVPVYNAPDFFRESDTGDSDNTMDIVTVSLIFCDNAKNYIMTDPKSQTIELITSLGEIEINTYKKIRTVLEVSETNKSMSGTEYSIKTGIPAIYFMQSLNLWFTKGIKDRLFEDIYSREVSALVSLLRHFQGKIYYNGREYDASEYNAFINGILLQKYTYLKEKISNSMIDEYDIDWFTSAALVKIDDSLYTIDFVNIVE